jgi:hypothetical protein
MGCNGYFMDFSINGKIRKKSYEKRTKQKAGKILASKHPILTDLEVILTDFWHLCVKIKLEDMICSLGKTYLLLSVFYAR